MIMDRNGQIPSKTGHDHEAGRHEVVRALLVRREACSQPGARDDGLRIALAIEGGGMRGVISAGMALALDELGLVPAFDAIYGASAGAITGAWLVSRPDGLRGWAEPEYARILIRRSALLRGRPVADVRALVEDLYQTTYPMDFAAVLASPVELHPLATDAATGESTDLHPLIRTPADLRLALRASAALPLLAGPAVSFAGRRFYDAGVSESVPYRTALTQGATHILVLRSRRAATPQPDPHASGSRPSRASARPVRAVRPVRPAPPVRAAPPTNPAYPACPACWCAPPCAARPPPCAPPSWPASPGGPPTTSSSPTTRPPPAPTLARGPAPPAVFSIRPAAGSPMVSRLATDGALLQAALESGHAAALAAFRDEHDGAGPLTPPA